MRENGYRYEWVSDLLVALSFFLPHWTVKGLLGGCTFIFPWINVGYSEIGGLNVEILEFNIITLVIGIAASLFFGYADRGKKFEPLLLSISCVLFAGYLSSPLYLLPRVLWRMMYPNIGFFVGICAIIAIVFEIARKT